MRQYLSQLTKTWIRNSRVDRITAYSTFLVALATVALAIVTCSTDQTTRLALVAANRAWLVVEPKGHTMEFVAPNLVITLHVQNVGKGPAIDINDGRPPFIQFFDLIPDNEIPPDSMILETGKGLNTVEHGMIAYPTPADIGQKIFAIPVQGEQMLNNLRGVKDGTKGILIMGCIAYSTFNETRYTQYCFIEHKLPDSTIRPTACVKGAYAT